MGNGYSYPQNMGKRQTNNYWRKDVFMQRTRHTVVGVVRSGSSGGEPANILTRRGDPAIREAAGGPRRRGWLHGGLSCEPCGQIFCIMCRGTLSCHVAQLGEPIGRTMETISIDAHGGDAGVGVINSTRRIGEQIPSHWHFGLLSRNASRDPFLPNSSDEVFCDGNGDGRGEAAEVFRRRCSQAWTPS